ncbi:CHAP domain-containing protein [Nonlabens sp. Hel1_33_55]|uniref:CHAP domain-containing protein n=1 Tax=Nonlabens sp. Hel1_33_55 TaxID=1336802 RepID=UPI000875D966|nr:CHAP domain-containing protein [Nonlabens sp. Hel1_33_55]SCY40837.1 CHAP domain-containing protein [Nonlabens sp. Hel1_33_55]
MSKSYLKYIVLSCFIVLVIGLGFLHTQTNLLKNYEVGDEVDSFNGVVVYYNGSVSNVEGRRVTNGYNVGLKYQCVEFVKRYYLEYLNHKMPDSYGHAKSFYNPNVVDGTINKQRGLLQYRNGSLSKPKVDDLIVMDGTMGNPYGHVAIISKVNDGSIEIIQQNPGPTSLSRVSYKLTQRGKKWIVEKSNVLGWLRK